LHCLYDFHVGSMIPDKDRARKSRVLGILQFRFVILICMFSLPKFKLCLSCVQNSPWYALTFVILATTGLSLLIYEFTPWARPDIVLVTGRLDFAIACLFFCDFILGMVFNNGGLTYLRYVQKNWLDLLASIPLTYDMARMLRILRIFKALRIISASLDFLISEKRYKGLKSK
jgi:hypothetical protein